MSEIRSGIFSMAIHGGGLAIRLGFMLLLLRYASPAIMGLYGLAVAMESVAIYLAGLEFHTFTSRRFARSASQRRLKVLMRVHRRLLAFTAPLATVLGLFAAHILNFTTDTLSLLYLGILLFSGTIMQELSRYLILNRQPVHSIFIGFLRTAAWQPIAFFFLHSNEHVLRDILFLWAIFSLSGVIWGIWVLRKLIVCKCRPRKNYLFRGLYNARAYYVISAATVLQGNLERFILQMLLGPSAVGVFSFFQTLGNTLGSVAQTVVTNIALPELLMRFGQKLKGRQEYMRHVMKRLLICCTALSAAICLTAWPLILVLSRQEYTDKLWMLPFLLLGQGFIVWTQPIHLALYAGHKDRILLIMMGGALLASILANLIFIELFGIAGAVVSPLVVAILISAVRKYWFNRLSKNGEL
ncbi:hypothetical protein [Janthinobacterium sp. GMG1]|uniref:lipopolysaccharide biosynthesis protein n=1 Tax=Janthinobacterium sp. GMG1 TaxID=3096007 RepID=UPI002ACA2648|nr:hypothetical protein [Janthinobacterium sp. GMG1]MDZ5632393.1 hypothetical protein [Janthinobacterium sp. GMG1]